MEPLTFAEIDFLNSTGSGVVATVVHGNEVIWGPLDTSLKRFDAKIIEACNACDTLASMRYRTVGRPPAGTLDEIRSRHIIACDLFRLFPPAIAPVYHEAKFSMAQIAAALGLQPDTVGGTSYAASILNVPLNNGTYVQFRSGEAEDDHEVKVHNV